MVRPSMIAEPLPGLSRAVVVGFLASTLGFLVLIWG